MVSWSQCVDGPFGYDCVSVAWEDEYCGGVCFVYDAVGCYPADDFVGGCEDTESGDGDYAAWWGWEEKQEVVAHASINSISIIKSSANRRASGCTIRPSTVKCPL
jgi:hypothetical protein